MNKEFLQLGQRFDEGGTEAYLRQLSNLQKYEHIFENMLIFLKIYACFQKYAHIFEGLIIRSEPSDMFLYSIVVPIKICNNEFRDLNFLTEETFLSEI